MKLIRKIESEINKLLVGYAFNDKTPEVYPKAYLRAMSKDLQHMRVELIERLHGTTPFYIGSDTPTMCRDEITKVIMDTIAAIKEVLVEECKALILDDIIIKDATSHTALTLRVNLPDDSETLYIAKHAIMHDAQYQIIREFIFHVFLGTHKQLAKCEYRIVKLVGICDNGDDTYLVTENAEFGNLIDVTLRPENKIRNKERVLLHDEWYYLLNDVIIGMRHMHGSLILHRNLDSTNILVRNNPDTGKYQALITGLGSAAFYNEDLRYVYPHIGVKYGKMSYSYETIRGMTLNYYISPPEVLHYFKFSTASDSYSFGVILWRLLFDGRMPYANADDFDSFLDHINYGEHLEIDESWEYDLKDAMMRFLSFDPNKRPLLAMNSTMMLLSNLEKPITELSFGLKELQDRVQHISSESSSEAVDVAANDGSLRCLLQ
jgi:serine/threonine protein kinase